MILVPPSSVSVTVTATLPNTLIAGHRATRRPSRSLSSRHKGVRDGFGGPSCAAAYGGTLPPSSRVEVPTAIAFLNAE